MACVMNYSCFKSTERTRPRSPKIPHYKNEKRERGREGTGERERGGGEGVEIFIKFASHQKQGSFLGEGGVCICVYFYVCVVVLV